MAERKRARDRNPNADNPIGVEVEGGYAVVGPNDNPIIQALISGEPLPQERAERAEDERHRARGETAFTSFNAIIPAISRAALLGSDAQHELGLLHNFILEHWRDHGNPLDMTVERLPHALLVLDNGDSYLRAIEITVRAAGTATQVRVDCAGGIYLGDDARSAKRYQSAAELAQALGGYLERLARANQRAEANATQPAEVEGYTEQEQNEIQLPDPKKMKVIWKQYSSTFALEIAKELPKAYAEYRGGRTTTRQWGPSLVGEITGQDRSRISTLFNTLKKIGWTSLNGVPLDG